MSLREKSKIMTYNNTPRSNQKGMKPDEKKNKID